MPNSLEFQKKRGKEDHLLLSACQDKLLEVSDAEVLQKLEKRLAAKEQELDSQPSMAA